MSSKFSEDYLCEYCEDTGEVSTDEVDESGNVMRGVGTRKCICQLELEGGGDPFDTVDRDW